MKAHFYLLVATLFICTGEAAARRGIQQGPANSPLTWRATEQKSIRVAAFAPPREAIGSEKAPTSVTLVELNDERTYGEPGQRLAWLARYEGVSIEHRDSSFAISRTSTTITLAFDAASGNLLCAFTDPAPLWARSQKATPNIEITHGWKMYPAHYEELRSSVIEVLSALSMYHRDPTQAGQLILRPRFNNNEIGTTVLQQPPGNVWIVEILGRFAITSREGKPLTTRVVVWRDGELKELFGIFAP